MVSTVATALVALLVSLLFVHQRQRSARRPPGARGLPLIGNAFQIPKDKQWLVWDKWRRKHGDLVSFRILGSENLVLSSYEAATELLDTRGLLYSDRPQATMAGELVGWNRGMGYSPGPPNPRFRELRRLFHTFIGPRACDAKDLQTVQEEESIKLLDKLLDTPHEFMAHTRDSTAAVLLRLAYGYDPSQNRNDPISLVKIVQDAMDGFSLASEPGWWCDTSPGPRSCLCQTDAARPGAPVQIPFDYVKQERLKGTSKRSFISTFLDERHGEETTEDEDIINAAAASLYSGGAETTVASLDSHFLAMTLFPHIQHKAQSTLDTYLLHSLPRTNQRLPTISDRPHLPYLEALMYEILRWNPSVPLGLPHVATQDDEYRGYTIQKGTVVWANIWSILQDEDVFPDPTEFRPERYLDQDGRIAKSSKQVLAVKTAFGFGRRVCPGLYLAENSVFLAIAMFLFALDVSPHEDRLPEVEYDGFISHPRPFKCKIRPRSPEVAQLIRDRVQTLKQTD
ncbi:cytochrome P450 [Ephemerocybe angulata]|uniref:Cytochrome P450 n=1 Tax=Ephemerocybe angulata TaxID=980116 RepID=A0A8H6LX13_9AGAR|nr:cytochrome P450 [Tulosesus angulatus]